MLTLGTRMFLYLQLVTYLQGFALYLNETNNYCQLDVVSDSEHVKISDPMFDMIVENVLYGKQQTIGLFDGMTAVFFKAYNVKSYILDELLKSDPARDFIKQSVFNTSSKLRCDGSSINKTQIIGCLLSVQEQFTDYGLSLDSVQRSSGCFDTNLFGGLVPRLDELSLEISHVLCSMVTNGIRHITTNEHIVGSNNESMDCAPSGKHLTRVGWLAMVYQLIDEISDGTMEVRDQVGPICPYGDCTFSSLTPNLAHTVEIIG